MSPNMLHVGNRVTHILMSSHLTCSQKVVSGSTLFEGISYIWKHRRSSTLNKAPPWSCLLHKHPRTEGSCSNGVCLHTYNISPCVIHPAPPVPVRKKPEVHRICFHGTTPQLQKENQERALTLYLSSCPVEKPLTKSFHLLNPSGILPKALVSVDPGDFWQLLLAFAGFQPENKKW